GGDWIEPRRRDLVALKRLASIRVEDGIESAEVADAPAEWRHRGKKGLAGTDAGALIVREEESPVLPAIAGQGDWAADSGAELVHAERRLDVAGEKVPRIEGAVAQELEYGSMELVRARLQVDVHHCAAGAPEFGAHRIRLNPKFGDRVRRRAIDEARLVREVL